MQSPFRIFVCRSAFFLLALLPTCLVGAWAMQRSQPVYRNAQHADWERFLSQRLGLQTTAAQVSYPSYWVARLDGLELVDPESKSLLLSCRSFEAARTKTTWLVEGSQPTLVLDHIGELVRIVDQRLLREMPPDALPCEIVLNELNLKFGAEVQTLTQVSVICRPIENGAELVAQFRIAGNETTAPCRLIVRRVHAADQEATTSWEFASEEIPLPCALVAEWLPVLNNLGPTAQFVGVAKGTVSDANTTCELQGRMLQVDLDRLVSAHSIHRLSGLADVSLGKLRLENGRIVELNGAVDCRGGYVSEALLRAAQEYGHFGADTTLPLVQDGLVAYRRLAARFEASSEGVRIEGMADPTRSGVVLGSATQALLLDPTQQPVPSTALVRMLVPADKFQVPATKETLFLLQAFPYSSAKESPNEIRRPKVQLHPE